MSIPHRPAAPRGSSLTADEEALWDHVTKDVEPVRGKRQVPAAPAGHDRAMVRRLAAAKTPSDRPKPAPKAARSTPVPVPLDRRSARRIASGRAEIDASIDLHGMRQSEAHRTLSRFLSRCRADGCRTVLVITGKGGTQRKAPGPGDAFGPGERGVLKSNVPRWLAEPDLSAIVIGFTTAHARHGGDGALYVTLRRK
jgi:DNA-nicking Smr family endonuclease